MLSGLRSGQGRLYVVGGDGRRDPLVRLAQLALQCGVPVIRRAAPLLPLLLLGAIGCVQPYEPPTADQPHAVVKLRRTYDTTAGTLLGESVDVDENYVLRETTYARLARAPLTDSFLAHPIPGTFLVQSNFFHRETHMVSESYQEPHTTYSTESYSCGSGFGANATYRTCTRSVSHTTYTTRYRTVPRVVDVSDGACARQIRFAPKADHVYLLQYTYQAPGVCRLSCFEQLQGPDGTFQNRLCPKAPPPVEK